jgi:hypothetical protein
MRDRTAASFFNGYSVVGKRNEDGGGLHLFIIGGSIGYA